MARVQFDHVYKRFNKVEIVHDINLDIKDKEFLVLVGPSGCGKSTCLRMIAGLEELSEGTISINDRIVNNVAPKDRDIAMVFQNYALYPHMSVFDNMAFSLKLRHVPKDQIKKRVEEAGELLNLDQLLKRKPKELSGGQRQRVGLARALAADPPMLLMDEPFGALDPLTRAEMQREFKLLQKRLGTTVVFVTHDVTEALLLGDRIALMESGASVGVFTPEEFVRSSNENVKAYVEIFQSSFQLLNE